MKKVLGIIGSPRKLGNSEIMIKEISRQISVPHELKLLRLSDFNIRPCRGCFMCLFKEERCVIDDDFYIAMEEIVEADALIVAAPTYLLGPNACLKNFLDRGLAFYSQVEKIWGKPSVGIGVAGMKGKEGYTILGIQNFLKMMLTQIKQIRMVYGALPGEIFLNNQNRQIAADLAAALFEPLKEKKGPHCPVCGGDTFRFFGDNTVQCMLCSNSGTMIEKDTKPFFEITKSDHELFLTLEDALEHRKWLIGMKSLFMENKKKLEEISVAYLKEGQWVKP